MEKVNGERPLKATRLKFFEDLIRAKTFADPTWSQGLCKADGKTYRLDGQHTSTQLVATPPDLFPANRNVQICTYEFDDFETDAANLFNKFDNPHSTRTNQEMGNFYKSPYDELDDIEAPMAMRILNGIYEYETTKGKGGNLLPPRVRGLYWGQAEYRMFSIWLDELFKSDGLRLDWLNTKSGIVAEMVNDWKLSPQHALVFWLYVMRENHPDVDHITRQLGEDFKKWRAKPERHSQNQFRTRASRAWVRYQKEVAPVEPQLVA